MARRGGLCGCLLEFPEPMRRGGRSREVSGDLDQGGVAGGGVDGGDHDGVGARGVDAVAGVLDAGACAVGAEEQDVEPWGVFPGVFGVCIRS